MLRDSDRLDCSVRVGHMSLSLVALLMYVWCACMYCTSLVFLCTLCIFPHAVSVYMYVCVCAVSV